MGRPPKKSCNACCSTSETPGTPDPPSSPTSCDDMINILLLSGTKKYIRRQNYNTWNHTRSQEETDNEYLYYRAAFPNRIHIFLELNPTYLPGYFPDVPRASIRYPSRYGDSDFDLSFWGRYGVFADRHPNRLSLWNVIVGMINELSTEVQNSFNNAAQVCIDPLSDRYLRNALLQPATAVGRVYTNLVNDAREAGKSIVAPVGYTYNSFTNADFKRVQTLFAGFAHHECCNSAAADQFRKFTTAIPDCFPTLSEEPDSEYKLILDQSDIFANSDNGILIPELFHSRSTTRYVTGYGWTTGSVTLNSTLLKGDEQVFDRAVTYILQKKDLQDGSTGSSRFSNGLGDKRFDSARNEINSFSDLFPLAVEYPNIPIRKDLDVYPVGTTSRTSRISGSQDHNRIPLKYAKTLNVHKTTNNFLGTADNRLTIRELDLISTTHPGDVGDRKFADPRFFKQYPETGDAKLFRKAHAPDWFADYKIPVDFMAVEQRAILDASQIKVYVKRPVTDFETLTDYNFIYGGDGSPRTQGTDGFTASKEEKLGFKYTEGEARWAYETTRDTKNLAHFLLRTSNEKDTDDTSAREYWHQNEWVQIGDAIPHETSPKLACRQSKSNGSKKRTDLFLATGTSSGANIRKYNTDTETWDSYASIDLSAVIDSLGGDKPTTPTYGNYGRIAGRVLEFKVKHVGSNTGDDGHSHDAYLVLKIGGTDPQILVFKESNSSGNFELLFYTVGKDVSIDAGCSKLLVSQCNNSKTTGSNSTYEPGRSLNKSIYITRTVGGNVVHNDWYNATLFSIPESPATDAFVEPDVVFSEANGYLAELASCETVSIEAAGHAFVFTPSRLFRNLENGKVTKDLIMGMCQYIHPAVNHLGGVVDRRREMESRLGDLSIRKTRVTATAQFKTGWSCRKADLFYARDIPSRGIRHNFLNSPFNFFHFTIPRHSKPQIVLSHPYGFEDDSSAFGIGNPNNYNSTPLLNNNIDYKEPPGYEIAIPFPDYPNILFKSQDEQRIWTQPGLGTVVMDELFSDAKESTNDTGMLSNINTDKSYITAYNEDFHRLSRPGKVFLFKYTNYHGWSYRKMIPDRNGTFRYNDDLGDEHGEKSQTNTGHNVTGKPGLDSDVLGAAFSQVDSDFDAQGIHTQYGDVGQVGQYCRFVNTFDIFVNPRNIDEKYYIRNYKTMIFPDFSANIPTAKNSNGTYSYDKDTVRRSDIHTFFINNSVTSTQLRINNFTTGSSEAPYHFWYIPYYAQPRFYNGSAGSTRGVAFSFSNLFRGPFITTAAGESMGVPNGLFQFLDTPLQHLSSSTENYRIGGLLPRDFLPVQNQADEHLYKSSQFPLVRRAGTTTATLPSSSIDGINQYMLSNREFRIKAVHVRDDGTEDTSFSQPFRFFEFFGFAG